MERGEIHNSAQNSTYKIIQIISRRGEIWRAKISNIFRTSFKIDPSFQTNKKSKIHQSSSPHVRVFFPIYCSNIIFYSLLSFRKKLFLFLSNKKNEIWAIDIHTMLQNNLWKVFMYRSGMFKYIRPSSSIDYLMTLVFNLGIRYLR